MSSIKVSALTAKTTPSGSEELLINDGGVSKKITQTNLLSTALPKAGGTMTGNITLGTNKIDGLAINVSATSNLGLGTGAVDSITTGDYNVGVGDSALTAVTSGANNVAVGYATLTANTTGSDNTAVGSSALLANTTGTENVAVGKGALDANTTGAENSAIGYNSLGANTTGGGNAASGRKALQLNTTGVGNTAMGATALASNTTASYNTAVGYRSLYSNTTGFNNTANGYQALLNNTTGTDNTANGYQSLYSNTTGYQNTASGYKALLNNTTGYHNTAIGKAAGDNITTGSSNIIIGYNIDAPSASASNQLNIGGWITGAAGAITVPGSLTTAGFTSTGIDDNATSTVITIGADETVGISVAPETWHNSYQALQVGGRAALAYDGQTTLTHNVYASTATGAPQYYIDSSVQPSRVRLTNTGKIDFSVAPSGTADSAITWTTAMTIENGGNVEISNYDNGGVTAGIRLVYSTTSPQISISSTTTGTDYKAKWVNGNGVCGYITTSGNSTSYLTSSDYRLKENVVPMTGSIDRLKDLKPSRFNFKADTDKTVDGFLAHEAGEVVPECATGDKDAMKDEEYEVTPAVMDGETVVTEAVMGTRSVPDYQGIDQSKLSPLTISALQEAITLIEQLTARVTELENA